MSEEVRVLTVRQPWAWAIIHGGKDVENRTRNLAGDYRGPIAIHAGLQHDGGAHVWFPVLEDAMNTWFGADHELWDASELHWPWFQGKGAIIGVVDLVDVHAGGTWSDDLCVGLDGSWTSSRCSPWAEKDAYHLVLSNPRPLVEPIPYQGGLGLRRLPGDVVEAILAARRES